MHNLDMRQTEADREGWAEWLFGICRPNGRLGKRGSRCCRSSMSPAAAEEGLPDRDRHCGARAGAAIRSARLKAPQARRAGAGRAAVGPWPPDAARSGAVRQAVFSAHSPGPSVV